MPVPVGPTGRLQARDRWCGASDPSGYVLLTAHITELDRDHLTAAETVDTHGGRVLAAGNDAKLLERGWASSTLTAALVKQIVGEDSPG